MTMLVDRFGRTHEYLRISVTDRCNLRCRYCMPADSLLLGTRDDLLTFDQIVILAEVFVGLGIKKIRITGGEPLVRRDVEKLCARLSALPGLDVLAISTNGVLLKDKLEPLRQAGVQHLNVSLDTLRSDRFRRITLRDGLDDVLEAIGAAVRMGFPSFKINTVVMKGFNEDEIHDFVELARALSLNVRFIEYMPFIGNGWSEAKCIPCREIKEIVETRFRLIPRVSSDPVPGPAREYALEGSDAVIGFIATMSEQFCASCNRLRLTADGMLRNCLFAKEEVNLKQLLRSNARPEQIESSIRAALMLKWEKHPESEELSASQQRAMVAIGG